MYKMIVVDLDGTLLNDYKKVSEENLRAIKNWSMQKRLEKHIIII